MVRAEYNLEFRYDVPSTAILSRLTKNDLKVISLVLGQPHFPSFRDRSLSVFISQRDEFICIFPLLGPCSAFIVRSSCILLAEMGSFLFLEHFSLA